MAHKHALTSKQTEHVLCTAGQVWDNTPSVGEAPFLDSIWTALDEVTPHGGLALPERA